MKTFKVYKHPVFGFTTVKQGFSWPAFCFGIFWALSKKLWTIAGALFAGYCLIIILWLVTGGMASTGSQVVASLSYGYLWLSLVPCHS